MDGSGCSVTKGFEVEIVTEDMFLNSGHVGLVEDGGSTSESATAENSSGSGIKLRRPGYPMCYQGSQPRLATQYRRLHGA